MIHNEKQSFFLELVHLLQNTDVLTVKMQQDLKLQSNCSHQDISDSLWMFNFIELLHHKSKIYILSDKAVKNELMKLYYDDVLAKHYKVDRTINLLFRKYYWVNMTNDV